MGVRYKAGGKMGKHNRKEHKSGTRVATTAAFTLAATTTGSLSLPAIQAYADQWDTVAACESTSNWHINTENSFYGGLQFTQSTWSSFGGLAFASRADLATPEQQKIIAEKVLAAQGKGAWPVCGKRLTSESSIQANVSVNNNSAPKVPEQSNPITSGTRLGQGHTGNYSVVQDDTLTSIANQFKTTVAQLVSDNKIPNWDLIYPGQQLKVQSVTQSDSTPTTKQAIPHQNSQENSSVSAVQVARSYLGTPYRWGGNSHAGIDCSGLVQQVYSSLGKSLPRTADAQMRASSMISRQELRPGDVAFSLNNDGHAYHVAIYIGDGNVLEAPEPGKVVSIRPLYGSLTRFGRVA